VKYNVYSFLVVQQRSSKTKNAQWMIFFTGNKPEKEIGSMHVVDFRPMINGAPSSAERPDKRITVFFSGDYSKVVYK
jgi:hypothetical protein